MNKHSDFFDGPRLPKSKKRKRLLTVGIMFLACILFGLGIYLLILILVPKIQKKSAESIRNSQEQESNKNELFIQSAGISAEIAEGDISVLDRGLIWHRLAKQGNPEIGGNMVLTGHSFVWGYTPEQIKEKSILYNLGDAKKGDEVQVRWNGKIYDYEVSEIKEVKPNQIEIELPSEEPKLTIYTCTTGGSVDGRIVIIAIPKI